MRTELLAGGPQLFKVQVLRYQFPQVVVVELERGGGVDLVLADNLCDEIGLVRRLRHRRECMPAAGRHVLL